MSDERPTREELRQANEALRESEERLRIASELTSDYSYAVTVLPDGTTRLDLVTEGFQRITGYTLDEINAGGGWALMIHPDDVPGCIQRYEESIRHSDVGTDTFRIVRKDGVIRWGRVRHSSIRDASGRVVRIIGAVQDITEHWTAEEALRESREQMRSLSHQLITALEKERRRIARELHDEIGQSLTVIGLTLQSLKSNDPGGAREMLDEAITLVSHTINQVRNLSLDLRPSMLDDLGLEAALRWSADRQSRRGGFSVRLRATLGTERLDPELETACFRVVQEALTNAARHAQARQVCIEVLRGETELRLCVRDDGVGFDPAEARRRAARGASFGLLGMQERVRLLGGECIAESYPGRGTVIRACFPLRPSAERVAEREETGEKKENPLSTLSPPLSGEAREGVQR
jgi:PAS domain S-box-containing protein